MKLFVVGAIVLGAIAVFVWMGVVEGSVPRFLIDEFPATQDGTDCWLDGGKVRSIEHPAGPLVFTLESPNNSNRLIRVESARNPPDNFKVGGSVACKGAYRDGKFQAVELVTNCPSKYENSKESASKVSLPAAAVPVSTPAPVKAPSPDPARPAGKGP